MRRIGHDLGRNPHQTLRQRRQLRAAYGDLAVQQGSCLITVITADELEHHTLAVRAARLDGKFPPAFRALQKQRAISQGYPDQ